MLLGRWVDHEQDFHPVNAELLKVNTLWLKNTHKLFHLDLLNILSRIIIAMFQVQKSTFLKLGIMHPKL